jgi:multidrug efflux system membrane fusion protein
MTNPFTKNKKALITVASLLVLSLLFGLAQWLMPKKDEHAIKDKAVAVSVASASIQNVPVEIHTVGNVMPYSVVNIVPQVGGQLKKVYFTQGQYVKKGDLLFEIDPSPYQATLMQAQGNVERDRAQIEQAQANAERDRAQVGQLQANLRRDQAQMRYAAVEQTRYSSLQSQGAVSKEQLDQTDTSALTAKATEDADTKAIENAEATVKADLAMIRTAQGTLDADMASVDTAKIQLGWTKIRSPIDGRTGSLNVYEGNVVTANTNVQLVTIDQVQPIYVTFTVPEQYLDEVRKNLATNKLDVEVLVEGKKKNAVQGQVSFLENTVNTSTGTVVLRAAFANTELRLFPGQFVDVIVSMPPDDKTVEVPTRAIQTTQQGTAVWLVSDEGTAKFTPVEVSRTNGDFAAITKGVNVGDTVITDGQLELLPDAKVKIVPDTN